MPSPTDRQTMMRIHGGRRKTPCYAAATPERNVLREKTSLEGGGSFPTAASMCQKQRIPSPLLCHRAATERERDCLLKNPPWCAGDTAKRVPKRKKILLSDESELTHPFPFLQPTISERLTALKVHRPPQKRLPYRYFICSYSPSNVRAELLHRP